VRLSDHDEALIGGEDRGERLREEPMVVGDQNSDLAQDLSLGTIFRILQDFPLKR
jgi:hypothetical protein